MRSLLGNARLVVLLSALLATPLAAGCGAGDGDDDRKAVADVEQQALDAVDGVLHDIAGELEMDFVSGSRRFVLCGESYAPRGAIHRATLHFGPSPLDPDAAVDAAATAMEGDGWTVDRPPNTSIVEGEKDDTTLRLELGPAAVAVDVVSDCVETSDDVAREYRDIETADLAWD
jgi:hypothetical protein